MYISQEDEECEPDDYLVKFTFYGTMTICDEFGLIKYESCGGESLGTEVAGFQTGLMEIIPINR